jgi:hypothetical protein
MNYKIKPESILGVWYFVEIELMCRAHNICKGLMKHGIQRIILKR